jgi:hypothetical protein
MARRDRANVISLEKKHGGPQVSEAKRLKAFEEENRHSNASSPIRRSISKSSKSYWEKVVTPKQRPTAVTLVKGDRRVVRAASVPVDRHHAFAFSVSIRPVLRCRTVEAQRREAARGQEGRMLL